MDFRCRRVCWLLIKKIEEFCSSGFFKVVCSLLINIFEEFCSSGFFQSSLLVIDKYNTGLECVFCSVMFQRRNIIQSDWLLCTVSIQCWCSILTIEFRNLSIYFDKPTIGTISEHF